MSLKHRLSQHFSRNEHSLFGSHPSGQERRSTCPPHRLVLLTLGLLNVVLLLAAAVIGIYCAKANDFQIPDSDVTPLIVEMNYLRNNTEVIRAKEEAHASLARERATHLQLKMQIREKMAVTDALQRDIETLEQEKQILQANKTALEGNCARCLPGWRLLKSRCYYFTTHVAFLRKNWNDSRADCISRASDLVVIDDFEEQPCLLILRVTGNVSELTQQLLNENFVRRYGSSWWQGGFWVGLTGSPTDGTWTWINNGKRVNSTQWRLGQPNQSGIQSGNCGAFYYNNDQLKTLYNANCQQQLLNWVCEMDMTRT